MLPMADKTKYKRCHTAGTIPKSNRKIVERDKIDTSNTQVHDRSLSWCGTGTLINSGGVNFMYFYMAFVIKFSDDKVKRLIYWIHIKAKFYEKEEHTNTSSTRLLFYIPDENIQQTFVLYLFVLVSRWQLCLSVFFFSSFYFDFHYLCSPRLLLLSPLK